MAQSKHEIESLLAEAGSQPRHRFGQNFMIDQNLVRIVADAGMLTREDLVIEVGPGTGTLTEELLEKAGDVLAVEIDRDLAAMLRLKFADRQNFRLIEGDALSGKHELNLELLAAIRERMSGKEHFPNPIDGTPPVVESTAQQSIKLVANLPYNIASPLIINLLIAGVGLVAFTVQKEVALRLKASAGEDDYGPLSVMAQMLGSVELLRTLPPQAFWPAPKIDSALVRLIRKDRLGSRAADFSAFVHTLFSSRRKMLRKALAHAGFNAEELLGATGLAGTVRPEEVTPEQFLSLYERTLTSMD